MNLSIHSGPTRFVVAFGVFVLVLFLIVPYIMDPDPPLLVKALLTPTAVGTKSVGKLIPLHNIGPPENPFYEATPIHVLAGVLLIFFCILLYPFVTYIVLSLLSRVIRRDQP